MGVLPQVLEIVFEAQRKRIIEKLTQNKLSNIQNAFFYLFLSLWIPPTFKPHNFLISYLF
jgi:hypothetical protein